MGYRKYLKKYLSKGPKVSGRAKNAAQKLMKQTQQTVAALPSQGSMNVEDWLDFGEWVRVKSSNVSAIQYWLENKSLFVRFKSGATYVYNPVPRAAARDMFEAGSKGKFVWRRLRDRYPYARLS